MVVEIQNLKHVLECPCYDVNYSPGLVLKALTSFSETELTQNFNINFEAAAAGKATHMSCFTTRQLY